RRRARRVRSGRHRRARRPHRAARAHRSALRTLAHPLRFTDHLRTEPLMEPEPRAPDDERAARLARVDAMRARGEDPYPVRFDRTHSLGEVREHWDTRIEAGGTADEVVRVAGRIVDRRVI